MKLCVQHYMLPHCSISRLFDFCIDLHEPKNDDNLKKHKIRKNCLLMASQLENEATSRYGSLTH